MAKFNTVRNSKFAFSAVLLKKGGHYSTIDRCGIKQRCNHKVVRISEEGVVALNEEGKEVLIEGDTTINAFGMCPNKELAEMSAKII